MEYKGNMAKYKGSHGTKSLTICPICGNDILGSDLFCEMCGMRIHSHQQQDNLKEFDRLIRQHSILVDIDIDRPAPINIDRPAPINQEQPAHHQHSTLANKNKPLASIYGMHTLSEMPELKMVVDGTKSLTICPICGNDILGSDLFCEMCGMRIHSNKLNISKLESSSSQIFSEKQTLTFQNFSEWSKYWAELYVQNCDFWSYLIYEHIDDDDFSLPLIICAHKFQSLRDMKDAYITLCTYGQDRGFGMPNNDVFMCEEDLCWYVFLTCSDLPYVLLVADSFNGSIWGWADYFIPTPPAPISIEKSININAYNGGYAPIKTKRQMPNVKKIAQKHIDSNLLKTIVHSKANLRSRYIFYDERDYNNAKDALFYGNRTIYDKLYWYGDWGYTNGHDHAWRVDLYDDLTQEELEYAVGHIREHNGQYYKD